MSNFTVRQFSYKGQLSIRIRMFKFFDTEGHNDFTPKELAERFNCSQTTAAIYRRQWEGWGCRKSPDVPSCKRCSMRDSVDNPVRGGLCQWCRWEKAGLDLWKVYHGEYSSEVLNSGAT